MYGILLYNQLPKSSPCPTMSFAMLNRSRHVRSANRLASVFRKNMSHFRVIEHTVRCQPIRQLPGAVKPGYENQLRLAVKQYIPRENPSPHESDVTLIGAHANSFPKVNIFIISFPDFRTKLNLAPGAVRASLG